ncbi:small, acid-soluble spore protein L [Sporosarcina sp. E16_8]|uniref:small, acid-soluble spore protein L n=1 Tax=Sporosarcina sp. E16_8 TaxID=2789295 RepID=UPI001A91AFFC|nr:small, acid-soluble spore protein L [Sporosarcina sp. E16_8]MBO0587329.1 small, acid-soluble spore protein L [Sporosarcina sp. E16_8]
MPRNKDANSDSNNDKGKKATSVTPQGNRDTEFGEEPKSKLEEAAKKKNTK